MRTIKLFDGDLGHEVMYVRCELVNASAPVEVDYANDEESRWQGTPYQSADACHTVKGLVTIGKELAAEAVGMSAREFTCEWSEM